MRIKLLPEKERPVEKACNLGIARLSNSELIALIIHTGMKNKSAIGLSEDVLGTFPEGLKDLGGCNIDDLLEVNGIGKTKACAILAAIELGKRISACPASDRRSIGSAEDVANIFMEELRYLRKEHFKTVLVNSKGEIISTDEVSVGELSSTVVHPREVFSQAIRKSAAAVIFVHNHPSGDPKPSDEDIKTTKRLMKGGDLLGIRVLDHIIIGDGDYTSLRGMGFVE